jgi:hypothetical protein
MSKGLAIAVTLTAIAQQPDVVFLDPRSVFINLTIASHELDAATHVMRTT